MIVLGEIVGNPADEQAGFLVAGALFGAWAIGLLLVVHLRPVTPGLSLAAVIVDIGAMTALVFESGGAFSQARLAYVFVPITVAFRFRPALTAAAGAAVVIAYVSQALGNVSKRQSAAVQFIVVQATYLTWLSAATVLLAYLLNRQMGQIGELAQRARHLLVDALGVEERERQAIAEEVHDTALQNLFSARHDLQEAADMAEHPALTRAEATIALTAAQLRSIVTELHPLVLEEAGLEAALGAAAAHAQERGGFVSHVEFNGTASHRHHDRLLIAAARELLANAVKHARARRVDVRFVERDGWIVLTVTDDGKGFDTRNAGEQLAAGHIGLASQRARIESVGGDLVIESAPGKGTIATVRLPLNPDDQSSS